MVASRSEPFRAVRLPLLPPHARPSIAMSSEDHTLEPNFIFGLTTTLSNSCLFMSDEKIVYHAAGVLVIHDTVNKSQEYLYPNDRLKVITAMDINKGRYDERSDDITFTGVVFGYRWSRWIRWLFGLPTPTTLFGTARSFSALRVFSPFFVFNTSILLSFSVSLNNYYIFIIFTLTCQYFRELVYFESYAVVGFSRYP